MKLCILSTWIGIFFHPEKHVSQPVLQTPVKYTIMKAFETGLCTIPAKKGFNRKKFLRDFRQNSSVHGLATFTRIPMVSKVFRYRLWAHPDTGNFLAILTAVLLVYNISLNYVIL